MKCQKLVIETDGTSKNTKIFVDGKQIGLVQRFEFSADVNNTFPVINIQVARTLKGVVKTNKTKVRDAKTEKFVEKEVIEAEPLVLERII